MSRKSPAYKTKKWSPTQSKFFTTWLIFIFSSFQGQFPLSRITAYYFMLTFLLKDIYQIILNHPRINKIAEVDLNIKSYNLFNLTCLFNNSSSLVTSNGSLIKGLKLVRLRINNLKIIKGTCMTWQKVVIFNDRYCYWPFFPVNVNRFKC